MKLRPYQTEAVTYLVDCLRAALVAGLIMPTGAGKSITVAAILRALANGRRFKGAIVAAPQNHIVDGFAGSAPEIFAPGKTSAGDVTRFVAQAKRGEHFALLSTHALLVGNGKPLRLPKSLKGWLLVLDEGHHAGDATAVAGEARGKRAEEINKLSAFRERWVQRGGSVLIVTATPWRNDRADVLGGAPVYHRTLAEHMADPAGYCPPKLSVEHVVVKESVADFKDGHPKSVAKAARLMVERWEKDGRPKTVVIVPSRKNEVWTPALEREFKRRKARTMVTIGAKGEAAALRSVLDQEREVKRYGDSQVDVMIACRRFDEGTDWPLCSHVYVAGLPRQMNTTVQRVGRALRSKDKIGGHPHKGAATITFFAPRWSKDTDVVRHRHRDEAMMLACFMADHETGARFLNDPLGDVLRSRSKRKSGPDLERLSHRLKASDAERAEAAAEVQRIRARLGKGATAEALLKAIRKASDEQGWDDRRDVLTTLLVASEERQRGNEVLGKDIERRLVERAKSAFGLASGKSKARARASETDLIRAEMRAIWDAAVEAHGAETVAEVNPAVVAMVSEYTGMDARAFSESLQGQIDWDAEPLGTAPDSFFATKLSVSNGAVAAARRERGIPCFAKYTDWDRQPLGQETDSAIAKRLGVSTAAVHAARKVRGIQSFAEVNRIDWEALPLGTLPDAAIAKQIGKSVTTVAMERKRRGIHCSRIHWNDQPLGRMADRELASQLGVNPAAVKNARRKRGIPAFRGDRA